MTLLLVIAGAITASPALAADGPTVSATVTAASGDGLTVAVEATNLDTTETGAYAALIVKGTESGLSGSGGYAAFAIPFPTVDDGETAFSFSAPASALDCAESYEVLIWRQHSNPTVENIYGRGDVAVTSAQWDAVFGVDEPEPTPEPTEEPSPTPSPEPTAEPSPTPTPEPTAAPSPTPTPEPTEDPTPAEATAIATLTDASATAGATVHVEVTDLPSAVTGVYTALIERGTEESVTAGGGFAAMEYVRGVSDGAFAIDLVAPAANLDRSKNYEVIAWQQHTLPGDDTIYARVDVEISSAQWNVIDPPTLTVFAADGTTPIGDTPLTTGDTIVVKGSGYDPAANVGGRGVPIPNTLPQGTYVVFGSFAEAWQPSTGAASSTRAVGSQVWALAESVLDQVPTQYQAAIRGQWVALAEDGTFTATLTLKDPATTPAGGAYGVYTYGAGGVANAAQEQSVALNYSSAPSVRAEATAANAEDGLTVRVDGADFGAVPGVYAALIETGTEESITAGGGFAAMQYVRGIVDGAFSVDLVAPADALDRTKTYEVIVWQQHTNPGPDTIYTRADVVVSDAQWDVLVPRPEIAVATTNASADDGLTVRVDGSHFAGVPGVYAAVIEAGAEEDVTAGGGFAAMQYVRGIVDGAFSVDLVAPADALDRTKTYEVIVWQQHTNPGPDTIFTRADVEITAEQWDVLLPGSVDPTEPGTPTEPAPTTNGSLTWGFASSFVEYVTGQIAQGTATASNGATKTPANLFTFPQALEGTVYDAEKGTGTVSYAGAVRFTGHHGALDVTIANPQIRVSSATKATLTVTSGGEQVEMATLDLSPATRSEADGAVTYTAAPATLTAVGLEKIFGGTAPSDGLDDVTFTIGVATVITPPEVPTTPTTPVPPTKPTTPATPGTGSGTGTGTGTGGTPAATVPGGSLRWAISSDFATYVVGRIAQGTITVSNGATRSGSQFQFGQATGSTYNAATGTGTVSYVGSVRFTGHHGVLDVTISNPQIRITSPNAATLYVTSGGSQVALATLNLGAATKTTSGGAVTYTAAPASLTAAGLSQVFSGYSTDLNAVTFTIGAAASAPTGSTGTVATASTQQQADQLPATPPSTDGIELDADTIAALQSGQQVTVTVPGFQPNEEDIKVVVYSTPTLLGTVTADADGVATWTGSLPAALADGQHTLTFQGSIDRGVVFTLDRAATEVIGTCPVDGATLNWGYKESFRVYIEGIAHGGWELTDVTYEYPEYVWTQGTGSSVDPETGAGLVTYGGVLEFSGHDGALDTTLSDFRLELAGDTGYIVVDIDGTTQSGDPVEAEDVRFVQFALGDLTVTDGAIELSALPSTLTDAGAAAFGTYAAGEEFDPVSAVIPVPADCAVVAAPVAADDEPVAAPAAADDAEPVADSESAPVWPWALGGLLVVAAIAVVVGVTVARKRRAASAEAETAGSAQA